MKLIIQIPCLNEVDTLKSVIDSIPQKIKGIDVIETLVIDDGSTDGTSEYAKEIGVTHIIRNTQNKGLARSFSRGVEACLRLGADIIVNTDGDNQYPSHEIEKLVTPIINGDADIVIGNRGGMDNPHFSIFKRRLQVFGSRVISAIIGVNVPDAVSGFRAISRQAATEMNILTRFSYTIEMLVQAGANKLHIASVPITTNEKTRESRLFKSVPYFIKMSVLTLIRVYTMYRPLLVFSIFGTLLCLLGFAPIIRFLYFYIIGDGNGHIQSLIIGGMLCIIGFMTIMMGILADLISFNRQLNEKLLIRLSNLENKIDHEK